ncbi:MAG: WD40 repeat domain-containing protein, partial [Planctomycetia bacterium]
MSDTTSIDATKIREVSVHKHGRPLISCCWDPQQRFVCYAAENPADAGSDLVFRLAIDGPDGARVAVPCRGGHDSWVWSLAVPPDGRTLVTGGYDGRLCWFPLAADEPRVSRTIVAHEGWVRSVSVSPDGSRIATCGNDRLV